MKIKNIIRVTALLFITLMLGSCAVFRNSARLTPRVQIVPGQWIQLPTPEALGLHSDATQILTGNYRIHHKPENYTSEVHVEASSRKLVLVALSGLGGELFSLVYDGRKITSSSLPMPNAAMGIKHTLTDFIVTYAPDTVLRAILRNTAIKLHITARTRLLTYRNQPIIRITYQYQNPWRGTIRYQNLRLHYTLTIVTVSYKNNTIKTR